MMRVLILNSRLAENKISGENAVIKSDIKILEKVNDVFFEEIIISETGIRKVLRVLAILTWSIRNKKILENLIEKYQPELIHLHSIFPYFGLSALYAIKRSNIPIIFTLHNFKMLCLEGSFYRNHETCTTCLKKSNFNGVFRGCSKNIFISLLMYLNRAIFLKFYKYFGIKKFIAVSDYIKRLNSKLFDSNSIDTVGIIPNDFSYKTYKNLANLFESKLLQEFKEITFSGRVSKAKGIDVIKEIIATDNYYVNILGEGPEMLKLKNFCKKKLFRKVNFYGFRSKRYVGKVLSESFVTVVPSKCFESLSMTVIESVFNLTPVICSNVGGMGEIVKTNKIGIVVDQNDNQGFIDAIEMLSNNKNLYKELIHNCKKFQIRYQHNYKSIESVYESLISERHQ